MKEIKRRGAKPEKLYLCNARDVGNVKIEGMQEENVMENDLDSILEKQMNQDNQSLRNARY